MRTISQVARYLSRETGCTISPQALSNLFYRRFLDDIRCPVVGNHRLIPEDYLPAILQVLRDRGLLSHEIAGKSKSDVNQDGLQRDQNFDAGTGQTGEAEA